MNLFTDALASSDTVSRLWANGSCLKQKNKLRIWGSSKVSKTSSGWRMKTCFPAQSDQGQREQSRENDVSGVNTQDGNQWSQNEKKFKLKNTLNCFTWFFLFMWHWWAGAPAPPIDGPPLGENKLGKWSLQKEMIWSHHLVCGARRGQNPAVSGDTSGNDAGKKLVYFNSSCWTGKK